MSLYLSRVSSILVFLPLILGIYSYWKHGTTASYRILVSIFTVWGIAELLSVYLSMHGMNNHLWLNLQGMITSVLFVVYYYLVNRFNLNSLVYSLIIYMALALIWFVFIGSIYVWAIPFIILSNIMLISFSGFSLLQLLNQEQEDLFSFHEFWVHAGVLVYFTASLLYLSIFPILLSTPDKSFVNNIHIVHTVVNIIANLLYTIAFLCRIRMYKVKFSLQ